MNPCLAEFIGTALLILFGDGVVANVLLAKSKGNGSGWKNMQKRCEEINGKVTIESKDGKGTIISISLPYPFKIPSLWDKNRSIL